MDLETTRSVFSSWFEHLIDAWIFRKLLTLAWSLESFCKITTYEGEQLGSLTLVFALWLWLFLSSQLFLSTRQYAHHFLNSSSFILTTTPTDIILSSLYSQEGKAPRKRKLTTATQGCYSATAICCLHPKPTYLTTFSFSGLITVVVADRDVANSPVTLLGSIAKQHYTLACFSFLRKVSLLPRLVFHLSLLSTRTTVQFYTMAPSSC